jgi:hypothetical protein
MKTAKEIVNKLLEWGDERPTFNHNSEDPHVAWAEINDEMDARNISFKSSTAAKFSSQEKEWNRLAKVCGKSLKDIAAIAAAAENEGFPGVEGLYELTQDPNLFKLTDYANVNDNDMIVFSYVYGGNRLAAFRKFVPEMKNPSALAAVLVKAVQSGASNYGQSFGVRGNTVTIDYESADYLIGYVEDAKFSNRFVREVENDGVKVSISEMANGIKITFKGTGAEQSFSESSSGSQSA